MNEALIITGSNMGNREVHLAQAAEALQNKGITIIAYSSVYETEPWGDIPQQAYYNQALKVKTELDTERLLLEMLSAEKQLGRVRTSQQFGPRTIDIDLLLYADRIVNSQNLTLPHPRMQLRRFVLVPACEIAADWMHPILNKSLQVLLNECEDKSAVWKALI